MGTIDYEALIAARKQYHGDATARARVKRLAEIAENLRTLRERANEQATPAAAEPVTNERT